MNRPKPRPILRFLASGLGALLVLAVAACSPIKTTDPYSASDGIRVELSKKVVVENLFVLTTAEGEPGVLQAAVRNDGDATSVMLGDQVLEVPANGTLMLTGDEAETTTLPSVGAAPGATLKMELAAEGFEPQLVPVPVLDGTLPAYAELLSGIEG